MSERKADAWGVCYGDPNAETEEELELIEAWKTYDGAYSSALNWSHNNEGDPNYIVMPLYRKEEERT
ncbi:hypothetical protein [Exiguobacterium oxidotolerans]|uniref:hypothetical protein n=1 Tax=Exiguobacterium oxidotolerans TaxID=223958 RepID=UPI0004946752|nr:hypothetical protein [Exiguobacterium oxidotolerans]